MPKVEKQLYPVPDGLLQRDSLNRYLEDMRRKVNSQGDAIADATAGDIVTQFNALLAQLRDAGFIAR